MVFGTNSIPCANGLINSKGYHNPKMINIYPTTKLNTAACEEKRCQNMPKNIIVTIGGVTTL